MSKLLISSTLISIALLFQACSSDDEDNSANSMVSTNEYVLTELNKTQYVVQKVENGFTVDDAEGKVILFDIFATWCPPCKAEATHLTSLQEKFKDDLLILGITIENEITKEALEAFRSEFNAQYPLVNSSENRRFYTDVAKQLKLGSNFGIPLMALYKDGKLINFYQGAVEEEFLESDIKRALEK